MNEKIIYILYRDCFFDDEDRGLYHVSFQIRRADHRIWRGDLQIVIDFYNTLKNWCTENIPDGDYRLTKTTYNGIKISFKNQEDAAAFRLTWE